MQEQASKQEARSKHRTCYKLPERTENALASSAEEGRGTLRKAPVRRVQPLTRRCPNGETRVGACPRTAW